MKINTETRVTLDRSEVAEAIRRYVETEVGERPVTVHGLPGVPLTGDFTVECYLPDRREEMPAPEVTGTQDIFNLLRDAIQNERRVWIEYRDVNGVVSQRQIAPRYFHAADQQVQAWCFREANRRTFYIHRIQKAQEVRPAER